MNKNGFVRKQLNKNFGTPGKMLSTTLGFYGNVVMPIMTYKESRDEGHSVGVSAAKAIGQSIFYLTTPGQIYGTLDLIGVAGKVASEIGVDNAKHSSVMYKGQFGGNLNLSRNGYTMRQRGLNAINKAGINNAQNLGSEARNYYTNIR